MPNIQQVLIDYPEDKQRDLVKVSDLPRGEIPNEGDFLERNGRLAELNRRDKRVVVFVDYSVFIAKRRTPVIFLGHKNTILEQNIVDHPKPASA